MAVQLLVVIEEQDRFYFRYSCGESFANPERLPGVACCVLDQPFDEPQGHRLRAAGGTGEEEEVAVRADPRQLRALPLSAHQQVDPSADDQT